MNRNIRKIINKITSTEELTFEDIRMQWQNGTLSEPDFWDQLEELCFLVFLKSWGLESQQNVVYSNIPHLPYINPKIIIDKLNQLEISAKDIASFVQWYFTGFVNFFQVGKNKEIFIKEVNYFLDGIHQNLIKYHFTKNNTLPILRKSNSNKELNEKFDFFSMIADTMKEQQNSGVLYSEQYEYLDHFGLKKELQDKLFIGNVLFGKKSNPINEPVENDRKKDLENDRKKDLENLLNQYYDTKTSENKIVLEGNTFLKIVEIIEELFTKEEASKIKKKIKENNKKMKQENSVISKTFLEKEENARKRILLEQLDKYYDRITFTNKQIIEGEDLQEVIAILKELYPEEVVAKIKSVLLENNKKMRQIKLEEIAKILMSEEDELYFHYISTILYGEDISLIPYKPVIEKTFLEIHSFLNEYINLEINDQEILKEAYEEQILILLKNLQYVLPMPEYFANNR